MSRKKQKIQAIMNVHEGEEIAGMLITPHIPGTGYYKFLAKKRKDGKYEWAHFIQRENGLKQSVFRGEADSQEQLNLIISLANQKLATIFGKHIQLEKAQYDIYTSDGIRADSMVN